MARIPKEERWTLADLADFESLLAGDQATQGARRIYRDSISKVLPRGLDELARRRRGLRLWLEQKRGENDLAGRRLETGLNLASLVVKVLAFLAGVGIVRGLLLTLPEGDGRGFNIWLFLGVTLGLQWLFLIGGGVSWLFFRFRGRMPWSQELLGLLGRKLAGSKASVAWNHLHKVRGDGYGSVLGWRLGAISQLGSIWLGLGMVICFLGCLWFFKIHFYWESTLESLSMSQLHQITDALALPWSWLGEQWGPGDYGVRQAELEVVRGQESDLSGLVSQVWMRFFVLALLVWGILPRFILYYYCVGREKRALKALDFQEARHRSLWREMAKVERTVVKTSQADGVVLLDVGGAGLKVEAVRPFLLQQLRVNPESVYQTGVLDKAKEEAAFEAMKRAALGVVLAAEGWSLSGPQMTENYQKVRAVIGEKKPIRFLILGTVKGDSVTEVNETELAEWVKFVDGLRDPAVEVVKWEGSSGVSG